MIKPEDLLYNYRSTIVRVVDGDTVDIRVDLGFYTSVELRVRLIGINAPERYAVGGREATAHLKTLLPEGEVFVVSTDKSPGDKYGRWVASIWLNETTTANQQMITDGHAVAYP